jgi:starch synthase
MRILHVSPECAPMTKTGGLGDVTQALPDALRALGLDVLTLLPGYPEMLHHIKAGKEIGKFRLLGFECRLLRAGRFLVLDCPALYARDGGPYQADDGRDWDDNALRFGLLSRAAALLGTGATPLDWRPDVVHCHDWPAGLAPVYLSTQSERARTLMTVHNLAFQGNFAASLLGQLEIPAADFSLDGVEFYGQLSFLKGGIARADAVSTVSPTYAREIRTPESGCGLDGLLRHRGDALTGIVNGIDVAAWNPASDPHIAQRYDAGSLERKAANKDALQRRMGLAPAPDMPLLGMVARFTRQKGVDLVAEAADTLAALPAQLVVVGRGERELEQAMSAAAARHPDKVAVRIAFDEPLAHAVEAGADLFVMPSRFEPCGLNQMYSQRYGTLPVARATGGLIDTVEDGVTGFLFSQDLVGAVRRALAVYRDAASWQAMQRAAMARDFSWPAAARRYADLYRRLATGPRR